MSKHDSKTIELLSAYLDGELPATEAAVLEARLEQDRSVRERLRGLRQVVEGLHRYQPPPMPPTLDLVVARRIALERDRVNVLDRLERGLSPLRRHNPILPLFAVVIALAFVGYALSLAVARVERGRTEVVVVGAPLQAPGGHVIGTRLELAARVFRWTGVLWRQRGVEGAAAREVDAATAAGRAWLETHPALRPLADLDAPVMIELDGQRLLIRPAAASAR